LADFRVDRGEKINFSAKVQPIPTLKWLLLSMAAICFFTGYAKIKITGWNFDWGSADSIRSCLLHDTIQRGVVLSPFGRWLLDQSAVLGWIGATTLFLELSFLVLVLCRLPITLSVLGLLGMHVGILLSMRTNYLTDMGFVFTTFVAWDSLAVRLQRSGKLLVVYDAKCSFCARVLLLFRSADVSGGLRFIGSGHADAPPGHDYTSALYVFDAQGGVFRGYAAFAELFRYLGITRPLAWLMCLRPVEALGRRIYEWVAKNRGKISTCGI
jgi:predicted DCC family thiol-disulfide oxidoreductase YuxK